MFNIVLVEPEIPQNTGNIVRTAAATGCTVHLVKPLGFDISDRALKRAGLDYWHLADFKVYDSLGDFFEKNAQGRYKSVGGAYAVMSEQGAPSFLLSFHQGGKGAHGGDVPSRRLPRLRQRDQRSSRGSACRQLSKHDTYTNAGGGKIAESFQLSGDSRLRGASSKRLRHAFGGGTSDFA